MSYEVYRWAHLTGVLMLFLAFGGAIVRGMLDTELSEKGRSLHKLSGLTHGFALLLLLVSGFGLIAKLKIGFPIWVMLKLGIWLILGGLIAVASRKPQFGGALWWAVIAIGATAAFIAGYKPFL